VIQNNDYKLIAMAVHEDVDYLVSNDYALINVAKAYKKSKGIPKDEMVLMTAANLLWLMHRERKDLFGDAQRKEGSIWVETACTCKFEILSSY